MVMLIATPVERGDGVLERRAGQAGAQVDHPVPADAQQHGEEQRAQLVLLVGGAADEQGSPPRGREVAEQPEHLPAEEVGGEVLGGDGEVAADFAGDLADRAGDQLAGRALGTEQPLGGGERRLGGGLVEGPERGDEAGEDALGVALVGGGRPLEQAGGLRHRDPLGPALDQEAHDGDVVVGVEPLVGRGAHGVGPAVAPLPRA